MIEWNDGPKNRWIATNEASHKLMSLKIIPQCCIVSFLASHLAFFEEEFSDKHSDDFNENIHQKFLNELNDEVDKIIVVCKELSKLESKEINEIVSFVFDIMEDDMTEQRNAEKIMSNIGISFEDPDFNEKMAKAYYEGKFPKLKDALKKCAINARTIMSKYIVKELP